jgi:hypothetical protein
LNNIASKTANFFSLPEGRWSVGTIKTDCRQDRFFEEADMKSKLKGQGLILAATCYLGNPRDFS